MTKTMSRPTRWLSVTGVGIISAWVLAACGGGPPELSEITDEAEQAMEEATSFTYTMADPEGVHDDELTAMEFSGQTDQPNFHINMASNEMDLEILIVDETSSFLQIEFTDEELQELFGVDEAQQGQWIEVPESELDDLDEFTDEFDAMSDRTFSLAEDLSEEELDAVEVEETELEGQAVYQYTVPATGETETELYPGADTVAFYFLQNTSELVQVDASTGDSTATHTFSDLDEVELFEAPPEEERAELEWEF